MLDFEYRNDLNIGRVCLELSLKPFRQLDDEYIYSVCYKLFDEWKPLIRHADSCAIMMWTSDGSEILDYSGNIDDEFEWCKYIGMGNPSEKNPATKGMDIHNIHIKPVLYMENPPKIRYSDLKRIITALKKVGKDMYNLDVKVGETFDPGPEFAYSEFKEVRHPEISRDAKIMTHFWVYCASYLHADDYRYAAYPNGISEGTHFGEFLGKQFNKLAADVGFDYLWLSNGFGFSLASWNWCGELFNGEQFNYTESQNVRAAINEFWIHLTREIKDNTIEVRGSNLSTGMDISAHGCPIDDIYNYNIIAPPNSPWAALNFRFGLELAGYMSHIAHLPDNGYLFRFYTHDPWWINSPWFDRYGRSPHDIYLPLSITRIDEYGKATPPIGINFLSADDSFGELPYKCPNEVIPHVLEAFNDYGDSPGTLTWIYPFSYYCNIGLRENKLDRIIMDDWLIENAIDNGLPLNTVVSDSNFYKSDKNIYKNTVLWTCIPESDSELEHAIFDGIESGLKFILFGDTSNASGKMKSLIGVDIGEKLNSEFLLDNFEFIDTYENTQPSNTLYHDEIVSSGGISEILNSVDNIKPLVSVTHKKSKQNRIYSTFNTEKQIVWIRGSFPHKRSKTTLPVLQSMTEYFNPSVLFRNALKCFNVNITFNMYDCDDKLPIILNSRRDNAFYFNTFAKDTTITADLSYPNGAPAITDTEFFIENDTARYNLPKWWHKECRVFIKQRDKSKITVQTLTAEDCLFVDHRIMISGLKDAVVTFYAPSDNDVILRLNQAGIWRGSNIEYKIHEDNMYVTEKISGNLAIGWMKKGKRAEYEKLEF